MCDYWFPFPRYRIGPFEVESALLEHPAVAEAAAISSPDPLRGEVIIILRYNMVRGELEDKVLIFTQ